jgi:hypothetical protein
MHIRTLSMLAIAAVFSAYSASLLAQATVSPPVNHESGVIKEVFSGEDAGYRFCSYVLQWRDTAAFLTCTSPVLQRGDRADFVVYRTADSGRRSLRFANPQDTADPGTERAESEESHASITAGKAPIQQVFLAESDGYRSVGYQVTWHNAQVIVVDATGAPARGVGDSIDFQVIRAENTHELSFTLHP